MNEVKINRIYKHFKGDLYLVEDVAIHSETKKSMSYIGRCMAIMNYIFVHMRCSFLKLIMKNILKWRRNTALNCKILEVCMKKEM